MRKFISVAIALFLTVALVYLVAAAHGWADGSFWSERLRRACAGWESAWLCAALVIAVLASDLILPVPSSVVMTLSGTLLGPMYGGLSAFAGAMASALLGFAICRVFGRAAFARVAGADESNRVQRFLDRYGAWAIVLSRSVPMLTEVVSCLAGLGGMGLGRFAALSAAGTLPLCFVYAWAGAQGGDPAGLGWAVVLAFLLPALGLALLRLAERRRAGHCRLAW
jgi:uncharacterized membrane protein YdjX (TVP38/TMEM64 family)